MVLCTSLISNSPLSNSRWINLSTEGTDIVGADGTALPTPLESFTGKGVGAHSGAGEMAAATGFEMTNFTS